MKGLNEFSPRRPNPPRIKRSGTLRSAFHAVPEEGSSSLDFSQTELRVAALTSGDLHMLEALRAEVDLP